MSGTPYIDDEAGEQVCTYENLDAQDATEFLEDAGLRGELLALSKYEMGYGDDEDIREKAKRALRIGMRQIEQGRVSSEFLAYVAICIRNTLSGKEDSLDRAFRLARKPGHQPQPPQNYDHIICAFHDALQCAVPWRYPPARGEVGFDELEQRALAAAYRAMHGEYQSYYLARGFDAKSIADRMTETKRLLQERGLYVLDTRKGRRKQKK